MKAYGDGSLIWGVFFGFHLALIAYFIITSDFLPNLFGALFLFASVGYFLTSFGLFVFFQYDEIYSVAILATAPATFQGQTVRAMSETNSLN
jgi:hypothetical protein